MWSGCGGAPPLTPDATQHAPPSHHHIALCHPPSPTATATATATRIRRYRALREEAPIYKVPGLGYYVISRHADITRVCRDTAAFSSNLVAILLAGGGTLDKPAGLPGMATAGVVDLRTAIVFPNCLCCTSERRTRLAFALGGRTRW